MKWGLIARHCPPTLRMTLILHVQNIRDVGKNVNLPELVCASNNCWIFFGCLLDVLVFEALMNAGTIRIELMLFTNLLFTIILDFTIVLFLFII